MNYHQIQNKEDLNILRDKSAQYKELTFSFSEKYLQEMKDLFDLKNNFQLFAKNEDGEFAGYISAAEKEIRPGFLWLVELLVDPKFQGQGVGTELVKHVIQEARDKNMSGVITQTEFTNIPAQQLYERSGFVKIDNQDWKDGITYLLKFDK